MRKPITAALALLTVAATGAGPAFAATDDWTGVVKAQASYVASDGGVADITVDVVYDQPGRKGLAHGVVFAGLTVGMITQTSATFAV